MFAKILFEVFLLAFGAIALWLGIKQKKAVNEQLIHCTETVVGKVVDYKVDTHHSFDKVSSIYTPIVEYTVNGELFNKEFPSLSSTMKFEIESEVTVCYNPQQPQTSYLMENIQPKKEAFVKIAIGIVFIALGFAAMVYFVLF